jgi:hypothetical protein
MTGKFWVTYNHAVENTEMAQAGAGVLDLAH